MATVASLAPKVASFLVDIAGQRRKTTYGEVARAVGTAPRVVPMALEIIRALCIEKDWPALTSIVVSAETGRPGEAFLDPWLPRDAVAAAKDAMTGSMQDEVYAFDWAPLLAHFGVDPRFLNVTIQARHSAGNVCITFPDGFQTNVDRTDGDLFEHLRLLLMQSGKWPQQ